MKLLHTNAYSVIDGNKYELKMARSILKILDPNRFRDYSFRQGTWDGFRNFNIGRPRFKLPYKYGTVVVPVGLVSWFLEQLDSKGVSYSEVDLKTPISSVFPTIDRINPGLLQGITLRDYQLEMIEAAIDAGRGILWCPPRTGKTEVMLALASLVPTSVAGPTLYLSDRLALVQQTVDRAGLRGVRAKMIRTPPKAQQEQWSVPQVDLVASTVQTLSRNITRKWCRKLLTSVSVLFVDECHSVHDNDTWISVIANCDAVARFGFSGTPYVDVDNWNHADAWLNALFGGLVYYISPADLAGTASISLADVYIIDFDDTPCANIAGSWHEMYRYGIVNNDRLSSAIADVTEMLVRRGMKVLVSCVYIEHGRTLLRHMRARGLRAVLSMGGGRGVAVGGAVRELDSLSAAEAVRAIDRGAADVLVGTVIYDQGVDMPKIDAVVVGSGRQASTSTVQRAFRPLTARPGKQPVIIDFITRGYGPLEEHTTRRIKLYEKAGLAKAIHRVRLDEFLNMETGVLT